MSQAGIEQTFTIDADAYGEIETSPMNRIKYYTGVPYEDLKELAEWVRRRSRWRDRGVLYSYASSNGYVCTVYRQDIDIICPDQ